MKLPSLVIVLLVAALGVASAAFRGDTVNATCPISGQPVDGKVAVEHAGKRIGVCCGKCETAVKGWSAEQKDAYLAKLADAGKAPAAQDKAEQKPFGEPYLVTECPVAGGPLGDSPVEVTLEGRPILVCCAKCKAAAEKDPAGTLAKVDTLIAEQQRARYAMTNCVVMPDEALVGEDGADTAKEIVVGNRLFRVCCPGCIRKVKADPAKFAALLDEAAAKAQAASYPLDHCVVNPKAVFSAETPAHEFVVAGQLVRTCCANCEAKVRKDPRKYLPLIKKG